MSRKPSRSTVAKKAWATRRANKAMEAAPPKLVVKNAAIPLYAQLDDALAELEARLSGTIRRIKNIGV